MSDSKHEQLIKDTYYNPKTGYIGINKLYNKLKNKGITKTEIKKVLSKQYVYQLDKPERMGSFVPPYPLYQFQISKHYKHSRFIFL